MYGVPEDLDLSRLVGDALDQVCLGAHELQFRFRGGTTLSVRGHWELHDDSGGLVDRALEPSERDCYRLHRLLGATVTGFALDAPRSFALAFGGLRLTVFDDSDQYESFEIQPDGIIV